MVMVTDNCKNQIKLTNAHPKLLNQGYVNSGHVWLSFLKQLIHLLAFWKTLWNDLLTY